ncbi:MULTISPECIES: VOC family protein [Flavobacteriaceae]|uniref:VOC family protein n=1 Tax=Flavobacteriaceae TaxID=49546 RepID=UPI0014921F3F|nr:MULTISPECIES: VOC family protein [Allomuricauda]MDC6367088.1 VOC family protein [Muricauda sp. AC10]
MKNTHINYVEFKATDLTKIKDFYSTAFGWVFTDYGPNYTAFSESGLEGGFELTESVVNNGALVVLYHEDLVAIKERIQNIGGEIVQDIFSFPGGRRFHFTDPSGNELAIWSDK